MQTACKPFEADRHFVEPPVEFCRYLIDDLAAHHCFAYSDASLPVRPMLEQIVYGRREEVICGEQTCAAGDDPVAVMIRVAGKGDIEAILQTDQPLHGIAGGRIHAYSAVPVECHEAESRIDRLIHDLEIQLVMVGNRAPVVHACPAQRIDAHADARAPNRVHVDHFSHILDIGIEKIVPMGCGCSQRILKAHSPYSRKPAPEKFVGPGFDPGCDFGIRGTAVRGVVFDAATLGRVVGRRDDDAIRKPVCAVPVV